MRDLSKPNIKLAKLNVTSKRTSVLICNFSLFLATRESAYLHASMSAATMHTISRGCMAGKLSNYCACSEEGRPKSLTKKNMWGGCGDNLPYGYKFSKQFSDAGEQLTESSLESFSRVLMNLHNNEAGRWVSNVDLSLEHNT